MNHKKIEKILGVEFKNENLLTQVFVHRSYLNEHPKENLENNERLEFLGDAILSLIVSESFFNQNKKANEGQLTTLRSQAVRTETLAKISEKLDLGDFMLLSKGEDEGGGRKNPSLLANVFEALIAAIYIEYGIEKVKDFIEINLFSDLEELTRGKEIIDFKSQLQKVIQEQTHISPNYKLISESGPEHKKTFEIGVFSKQKLLGKGKGFSKQQAQQQAAFDALKKLGLTS